jgi:hypothetical protein
MKMGRDGSTAPQTEYARRGSKESCFPVHSSDKVPLRAEKGRVFAPDPCRETD